VVHRDIKPGNILTIGSHALVTDFGVAKALSAAMPVSGMTSAGMAIGTPAYMAPEQLAADPAADHRIDIYAVGLLAYELLSGQSPFVGTSPQATMAAQLTRIPDPLDTVRNDVPPALAAVIMRCLEKLPENRPQTATALLDEIDGVSTPSAGTGASGAVTAKLPASHPSSSVQRKAVIAGVLLVVLAGVAVALGTWRRVVQGGEGSGIGSAAPASGSAGASGSRPSDSASASAVAAAVPPRPINDTAVRTPVVLSPAESLAIADAVRKRITARRDSQVAKGERAFADSLTRRFERALSDSLARLMTEMRGGRRVEVHGVDPKDLERFRELAKMANAIQGPNVPPNVQRVRPGAEKVAPNAAVAPAPPGQGIFRVPTPDAAPPVPMPAPGVRRVLLGAPRMTGARREFAAISAAIADSVRRGIGAAPGYDVVEASQLTDPRFYANRSRTSLARSVGAGAVLTGVYFPRPDSTVVLQLQVFDVQRNRVARVVESKPMELRDPMRSLPDLIALTVAALETLEWKPPVPPDSARKP
jgi:serine/threonine-protein kinase